MTDPSHAVLISGSVGSGKTSVAIAVGELLDEHGVLNAVIDLDWLCWIGPGITGRQLRSVLADNVASVVSRFRAEGVHRFVLARTIADPSDVAAFARALGDVDLSVVTLEVSSVIARTRIEGRGEAGDTRQSDLDQLGVTPVAIGGAYAVSNQNRSIRSTADDVLAHLSWLAST